MVVGTDGTTGADFSFDCDGGGADMVAVWLAEAARGGLTFMSDDCLVHGSNENNPDSIRQFNRVMTQVGGS